MRSRGGGGGRLRTGHGKHHAREQGRSALDQGVRSLDQGRDRSFRLSVREALTARRMGRPTDELIQLYALECFLDRLVHSEFAEKFVLKGGVLLAALDARRPTRDIDFAVRVFENSTEKVLSAV